MGQGKQGDSQIKQFIEANKVAEQLYKDLMKNQKKYEKMVNKMDAKQKKAYKSRMKNKATEYKTVMKQLKTQYKQSEKYMKDSDKKAHKLMYTERMKDIDKLMDEIEDAFDDVGDEFEDMIDESQSKWDEFAENLSEIAVNLSIADNITDALGDETKSLNELRNSLVKNTSMNQESVDRLLNSDILDQFDGLFAPEDLLEAANGLAEQGVNNEEAMMELLPEVMKVQATFDEVSVDDMEKMIQAQQQLGTSVDKYANQIKALDESGLAVNSDDLFDAFNENYDSIYKASGGNADEFDRRMAKTLATTAVLNDSWGDTEGLMDFLNEMKDLDPTQYAEYGQLQALLGVGPQDLQRMMQEGNVDQAMLTVVKGVQGAYASGNMSSEQQAWINNQFKGVNLDKLKTLDVSTLESQINTALQSIDTSESTDYLEQELDNVITSPLTKAINKLKSSPAGLWLSNLSAETGIDMSDVMLGNAMIGNPIGKGISKVGSTVWGGVKSLFGFGGAGATATTATTTATTATGGAEALGGAGALATLKSTITGAMSSALAPVASALGVGTGVAGATVVGGVSAVGGIFSGLRDYYLALKSDDEDEKSTKKWQGTTKLGMVGTGAAAGAAIGSVVPVVGTVAGGIIGAGVGGLGAIFGGDSAGSWLRDKWNGLSDTSKSAVKGGVSTGLSTLPGMQGLGLGYRLYDAISNVWGKDQTAEATQSVKDQDAMSSASDTLKEKSSSAFDNMMTKLNSLKKIASNVAKSYNSSLNSMNKTVTNLNTSTENSVNKNTDSTTSDGSSSDSNSGSNKTFKWYNPFTWFNSHEDGLSRVPYDGYLAELHKDETVLTAKEADIWRSAISKDTQVDGSHKDGLTTVPYDGYIAELHQGETVLPKEQADIWRSAMKQQGKSKINMLPREEYSGTKSPTLSLDDGSVISSNNTVAELHEGEAILTKDQSRSWFADATSWFSKLSSKLKEQAKEAMEKFWAMQQTTSSGTGDGSTGNTGTGTLSGNTQAEVFKSMSNQEFINWLGGVAVEDYANHHILPSLTIAQGIIESGWGKSGLTQKANALFGIKAGSSWSGKTYSAKTKEYGSGGSYSIVDAFRAYDSCEDSVADHGALLNGSRYSAVRSATTYQEATKAVKAAGYATDPSYTSTLNSMIKSRNLDSFDSQVSAYEQGTPWVPDTQVALLHKGEMVVPADENPINKLTRSSDGDTSDGAIQVDNSDIVDVVKWAVQRIERKLDETSSKSGEVVNNTTYNMNTTKAKKTSNLRDVFSF